MSDDTHSPGPWSVGYGDVADARNHVVARANWDINDEDGSAARWEADARLIAAAPDALALLREAVATIEDIVEFAPSSDVDDVRRAVAKTTGAIRFLLAHIDGKTR